MSKPAISDNAIGGPSLDPALALLDAHARFEAERYSLVRVLHDDLGGMLVGAAMDVGWLCQQKELTAAVLDKLARVSGLLRSAIDLKRALIEELQPSLLRNVGLFSTLRWHVKRICDSAGVVLLDSYPADEIELPAASRIDVFRLIQQSLDHLLTHRAVGSLCVDVKVSGDALHCDIAAEQIERDEKNQRIAAEVVFLTTMHYRILNIGGRFDMAAGESGENIHIMIPISPLRLEKTS